MRLRSYGRSGGRLFFRNIASQRDSVCTSKVLCRVCLAWDSEISDSALGVFCLVVLMQTWHRREYVVDQPSGTSDGAALMLSHAQRRRRAIYYSAPSALVTPTRSGLLCLSARTNLFIIT